MADSLFDRLYIGIDFGTSNTYVAAYDPRLDKNELLLFNDIASERAKSIPTCLLQIGDRYYIGSIAQDEFLHSTICGSFAYSRSIYFSRYFKRQIHMDNLKGDIARKDARIFLGVLYDYIKRHPLVENASSKNICIGCPSSFTKDYGSKLKQLFKEIDDSIVVVEEARAAALQHYIDRSISLNELLTGSVMVVDFGGGTLDITLMEHGGVSSDNSWGHPCLGGRLFDDLFLKWLQDLFPDEISALKEDPHGWVYFQMNQIEEYYKIPFSNDVLKAFEICSEGKTSLSEHFNKLKDVKCYIRRRRVGSGQIPIFLDEVELSYGEFIERAQNYFPTEYMLEWIDEDWREFNLKNGLPVENIFPCDLFEVIKQSILLKSASKKIDTVILTGGSSLWAFMIPLVRELWPEARVGRSADPLGGIASGVARYIFVAEGIKQRVKLANLNLDDLVKAIVDDVKAVYLKYMKLLVKEIVKRIVAKDKSWKKASRNEILIEIFSEEDIKEKTENIINTLSSEIDYLIKKQLFSYMKETGITLNIDFVGVLLEKMGINSKMILYVLEEGVKEDNLKLTVISGMENWNLPAKAVLSVLFLILTGPIVGLITAGVLWVAGDYVKDKLKEYLSLRVLSDMEKRFNDYFDERAEELYVELNTRLKDLLNKLQDWFLVVSV